jgi:hypothetical protein
LKQLLDYQGVLAQQHVSSDQIVSVLCKMFICHKLKTPKVEQALVSCILMFDNYPAKVITGFSTAMADVGPESKGLCVRLFLSVLRRVNELNNWITPVLSSPCIFDIGSDDVVHSKYSIDCLRWLVENSSSHPELLSYQSSLKPLQRSLLTRSQ